MTEGLDVPDRYNDAPPDDEVIFTGDFGVLKGLGLMMIKIDQGSEDISLSCNNTDVLKEVKRLLKKLSNTQLEVSDVHMNEQEYPQIRVETRDQD